MKHEIERYISKDLQALSSTAVPLHPDIELMTSKLTKENEDLRTKLTEAETRLDKLNDTEVMLNYLQYFKDQFTFYCLYESADITILRCANILKMGFCKSGQKVCRPRLELGKKLSYL